MITKLVPILHPSLLRSCISSAHQEQLNAQASLAGASDTALRLIGTNSHLWQIKLNAHLFGEERVDAGFEEQRSTHYEAVGDMVVRFLAQEERHSALRPLSSAVRQGR